MNSYEALSSFLAFANKQLEDLKGQKDTTRDSEIVLVSLYRKIIELSEGVKLASENGLEGPASLCYRGLIEAHLAFKFILLEEDLVEKKAKAYKVGYHKHHIDAYNFAVKKIITNRTIEWQRWDLIIIRAN